MIGTSLAGAAVAAAILFLNLRKWWTGGRQPKDLIPFTQGLLTGALGTACVGGLLGWLSGCTRQAANAAGGRAVSGATGTDSGSALAQGSLGRLSPEGGVVVFLLAIACFTAYKAFNKEEKGRLLGGLAAGFILCATAGVAGMLEALPGIVNGIGSAGRGMLEGQGL